MSSFFLSFFLLFLFAFFFCGLQCFVCDCSRTYMYIGTCIFVHCLSMYIRTMYCMSGYVTCLMSNQLRHLHGSRVSGLVTLQKSFSGVPQ